VGSGRIRFRRAHYPADGDIGEIVPPTGTPHYLTGRHANLIGSPSVSIKSIYWLKCYIDKVVNVKTWHSKWQEGDEGRNAHAQSNSLAALWPYLSTKCVSRAMGANREEEGRVRRKTKFWNRLRPEYGLSSTELRVENVSNHIQSQGSHKVCCLFLVFRVQ
jgi:hypothetical protein